MFKQGQKLIFTRPDGAKEPCTFMFKGCVPGCVVVQFNPRQMDGLTVPIDRLRLAGPAEDE